ncbi:MAG: hypothetical protein HY319_26180 [Armatimonadetes bacterium]|nr:hypothetical protein [Armatimonadota bacterium]
MDSLGELTWRTHVQKTRSANSPNTPPPVVEREAGPLDLFQGAATTGETALRPAARRSSPESPPEFDLGDTGEALERMTDVADQATLRRTRRELRASLREGYGAPLQEQARTYRQLLDTDTALERIGLEHRARQWEQVRGEVGEEPSPLYRSHFVNGVTPVEEMKEIVRLGQSLRQPSSPLWLRGNDIEPLTRHEIWKKKMDLLRDAGSRPRSVDAEYYELSSPQMIDGLARSARAGGRVRVLLDPGHLGSDGEALDATSMATRLAAVRQLEVGSGGRAAVQFFANRENLGARTEIMHRKQLRVGDEVVFGGMNANPGSDENVDFAMSIRGPAARELGKVFQDDVGRSQGRTAEEIYGDQLERIRAADADITLSPRGVLALLESQTAQPARPGEARAERIDRAMRVASYRGVTVQDLAGVPTDRADGVATDQEVKTWLEEGKGNAVLTARGRELLAGELDASIERMRSRSNIERLTADDLPDGGPKGKDTAAVGDTPAERQALLLHAIDSAERHIKLSAFVLTEDVARLLAEKKASMEAAGKPFDVQVVMDPGMYSYGGAPNEKGFKLLEDRGIPVKWAVLDRTGEHHDRKVHAKLLITDKMMLAGSTNFSNKGLRENWELSDVVFFGDNPESRAKQQEVEQDFARLWERESLSIDTRALAQRRYADTQAGAERDLLVDRHRTRTVRAFLRGIDRYEKDIGARVDEAMGSDPGLAYDVYRRTQNGESRGYAILSQLGPERMQQLRHGSPAWRELLRLREEGP